MELGEYDELTRYLEKDYVLYKKHRWWYFFGGAIAFLFAAGLVSYEAGRRAMDNEAVKIAIKQIQRDRDNAKMLVAKLQNDARNYPEFQLPSVAGTGIHGWKEILKLAPKSAIKIEAYSKENNYIQPWVIYAWRAYEEQSAGMHVVNLPVIHRHSAAIEWKMLPNGVIRARTSEFNTIRILRITSLTVLHGDVEVYPQN